jgi:hypothetical protein
MSYVTNPFEVMVILFIMSALAAFGVTTLFNKVVPMRFKYDLICSGVLTVVVFVGATWAIF